MIWIAGLILIGSGIGVVTKNSIDSWYVTLTHAPLTPPNYLFRIVWPILYAMIAVSGWMIWRSKPFRELKSVKALYILQLILNWSWTPLFFSYHLTGASLICLLAIIIVVFFIIVKAYKTINTAALLLLPYVLWLLFATYLNFYIWQYN